ncbi:MAG: hypothetical protein ABSD74_18260 [Rhizomicrobium sp.]|jgi:predicted nucleotidyltransferase
MGIVGAVTSFSLIDLGGIKAVLDEAFGVDVDVIVEPVKRRELSRAIERDRTDAF